MFELKPTDVIERDHRNKGVYSRVVYYDLEADTYVKRWVSDYVYRQCFEHAVRVNFFDGISLPFEVIEESGQFLGYKTKKSQLVTQFEHRKYLDLVDRISSKSLEHSIIYIDRFSENIVEENGKYYLIDLEPSIEISMMKNPLLRVRQSIPFVDYFYRKKIRLLLTELEDDKMKIVKHGTDWKKEIKFGTANGRLFLEKEYLPSLSGNILFVGVNYYTEFYHHLVQTPELFETLDVDENMIQYGNPNTHYVGNLADFKADQLYDHVCMFGIFGHKDSAWEITTQKEEMIKCISNLHLSLKKGGTLLLGPATQTLTQEFWDDIYGLDVLSDYQILMKRQIDINYIWHGKKR